MNRILRLSVAAALVAALMSGVLTGSVMADESQDLMFPVPEFSDHPIPTASVPEVQGEVAAVLDVAILFVALCLASYFTLVSRSRRNVLLLTIASLLWFGFWRQGCVCPIGATQNVALAIFDPTYVVPLTVVAFFILPLVFTLFFGRTFCASVCPLGAMQELLAVRSVKVPRWLDHSLGLVAYIYLGAAVIFAATKTGFIICRYDPFIPFFRLGANTDMLLFGSCVLLISVFVGRPYCRYLCPYGAILRVLSCFSKWRLSIPPDTCINCQLCEDVCPYGAIHPPTVTQSPQRRRKGKRQFVIALLAAPVVVAVFWWLGTALGVPLSQWHPESRLAEQVRLEELGVAETTTEASDAFRGSGRSVQELYQSALARRDDFVTLGGLLGAWTGLVIGFKLIHLSARRRRDDYQADRAGCVSCGRCYWYCPVEKVRLGLISDVSEALPDGQMPNGPLVQLTVGGKES
ncbi:Putative electron transport protein YccM [Stieleria neptunia]|uniref:Electron transport protein YccM n=1 Tax=Stieleria neptunia TaxID=2527979 RepID=A0A518HLT5_9BACT|nr:4Fe-4S binding protein [Stieleria neptunia]QDV41797.1 Putative electron transport protein YccM [Stieleria neptunia]